MTRQGADMLIVQISDTHLKREGELLFGRLDTQGYLERAVAHVNALDPRPDIALVTGDLVDGGNAEEYANLKRVLSALAIPFYLIPGNHDARDALRQAFPEHDYLPDDGFLHYVVEDLPLRLIALDTLVEGKGHGALSDGQLDWLDARLAESDRPTLLFMHHPPFDVGIAPLDAARLQEGSERLAEIVRRRGNVERVRPRPSPDPGALGRDPGLDRAKHRPSGVARSSRRRQALDDHGSARRGASSVAAAHGIDQPCELCRRLRGAPSFPLVP